MKNETRKLHDRGLAVRDLLLECARLRRQEEHLAADIARSRSLEERSLLLREGLSMAHREARILRSCAAKVRQP